MTSGARENPIQVLRSFLEATGAQELLVQDVSCSDLGLAAGDPPQGLSPYPQAWPLDLLEWALAAFSRTLGSAGHQSPGTVMEAGEAGKLGCFLALSLPPGF